MMRRTSAENRGGGTVLFLARVRPCGSSPWLAAFLGDGLPPRSRRMRRRVGFRSVPPRSPQGRRGAGPG